MSRLPLLALLPLLLLASPAPAGTVVIEASRDTTLIEHPDGAKANGAGPALFVGRTGQTSGSVRRALLYFDVAAALPAKAIVVSAALTLHVLPSHDEARTLHLHRVLADWGEGTSYATGGMGDDATPGDATWIHTFHDEAFWVRDGGQYVRRASASLVVEGTGFFTWENTAWLAQDVRLWHAAPHHNAGWILIGDESVSRTAKNVASREEPDAALRPRLEVTYRMPGDRSR